MCGVRKSGKQLGVEKIREEVKALKGSLDKNVV